MNNLKRILILIHFGLVFITVTHLFELINWNQLSSVVGLYSSYTYANRNFGFFAPTVNEDYVLNLKVYQKNDSVGHPFLLNQPNLESKIRYLTMLWHFSEGNSKSQMDLFARSWGLYCMNTDSSVNQVLITVRKNIIPTMKQFREGKRVTKNLYYQTTIYAKEAE